jgi:hypothetical protein
MIWILVFGWVCMLRPGAGPQNRPQEPRWSPLMSLSGGFVEAIGSPALQGSRQIRGAGCPLIVSCHGLELATAHSPGRRPTKFWRLLYRRRFLYCRQLPAPLGPWLIFAVSDSHRVVSISQWNSPWRSFLVCVLRDVVVAACKTSWVSSIFVLSSSRRPWVHWSRHQAVFHPIFMVSSSSDQMQWSASTISRIPLIWPAHVLSFSPFLYDNITIQCSPQSNSKFNPIDLSIQSQFRHQLSRVTDCAWVFDW